MPAEKELYERIRRIQEGGAEKYHEANKKKGKLFVRDRLKLLLDEGYTHEYGAREMDRVIAQRLKPLLMREILFGSLKQGGHIIISTRDGSLSIG